ncbi:MAG: GDSL-type esterase/lipase family protein [Halieaceae bacterium]|nr:GDSL-type esterase/lipase family protein [Halieaceae bacterium]
MLKVLAMGVGAALTLLLAYVILKVGLALYSSQKSVAQVSPISTKPANPAASLLVLGDSTAVGTGAGRAEKSLVGRISSSFPSVAIENRAVVGAVADDLDMQLGSAERSSYDVLLIAIGGNDVLRFTAMSSLRETLAGILEQSATRADHRAIIVPGMVGDAPAVPWPVSLLYNARSESLRQLVDELASTSGVQFVDLHRDAAMRAAFAENPQANYAADGLHPSGEGYALWYEVLSTQLPLQRWFQAPR